MEHFAKISYSFWSLTFSQNAPSQMYDRALNTPLVITTQKMKFSIIDFFSKCDQIRSFLRSWSCLSKKSLMENFIFCAVNSKRYSRYFADHIKKDHIKSTVKHLWYFHLKSILKICNTRESSVVRSLSFIQNLIKRDSIIDNRVPSIHKSLPLNYVTRAIN